MYEDLIELVRLHEVIYDYSSSEYRDQNVRLQAWNEIGAKLKITAENAKTKWDKLRRCFCNARNRRLSTKTGQATKKIIPWKYEQQMEFLLPYLEGRRTRGNLRESKKEQESQVFPEEQNKDDGDEVDEQEMQEPDEEAEGTNKEIIPVDRITEIMEENAALRKRKFDETETGKNNPNPFVNMDETDIFFLGLARILKKLPKVEQASVKLTVSNAILQAELRSAQAEAQPSVSPQDAGRPSTSSSAYSFQTSN